MSKNILSINNLSFYYKNNDPIGKKWKKILSDINMEINEGEIVGLVGLSGCGKTTLGKLIVNYFELNDVDYKMDGSVNFMYDKNKINIPSSEYRDIDIPPIQMVFQDPRTSLNMRMSVYEQLKESVLLRYTKEGSSISKLDSDIKNLATKMKLSEKHLKYTPSDMSGGQRRRFGLAKIMAMRPKLIIADEPVASLDVSIKEQIMDVIFDLNQIDNVTLVIISHDISLLMKRADKICVIHNGKLVEIWDPKLEPKHKATIDLVDDSQYVNRLLNS
mgnify:CR=1 FL=1|tara:strand:- start:1405 stop:2226 length:822 start_codon:yes stop_codon:yes gene_type:complete